MQFINGLPGKMKILVVVLLLIIANGLLVSYGWAVDDFEAEYIQGLNATQVNQEDSMNQTLTSSLVKMVFGLIVVIAIALITLKLVKKFLVLKKEAGWLQVIAYDSIGPNKGICVAKIGQKTIVLGVTEHNITKLMELSVEEADELELTLPTEAEETNSLASFFSTERSLNFSFHEHLQDSISKVQALKQRNQETDKR